jgi:hypothetical protein
MSSARKNNSTKKTTKLHKLQKKVSLLNARRARKGLVALSIKGKTYAQLSTAMKTIGSKSLKWPKKIYWGGAKQTRLKDLDENKWISNGEINNIIGRWLQRHSARDFVWMGTPTKDELASLTIPDVARNTSKKRFGGILFMDGHWVALFFSALPGEGGKPTLCYFDSQGPLSLAEQKAGIRDKCCRRHSVPEICSFIDSIVEKYGGDNAINVIYNTKVHQLGYNECGVYSCHYIINRLQQVGCRKINNTVRPDSVMKDLRETFPFKDIVARYSPDEKASAKAIESKLLKSASKKSKSGKKIKNKGK